MASETRQVPAVSATVTGGGDASATKQDAQTALLGGGLPSALTGSGNLKVAVEEGSAATPTGTAGTPSADVVSVQGVSGGTALPVSATALPLPSGASTAAKQPALGTAGTASADVITMQGIASMVPIKAAPCKADGTAVDPITEPAHGAADDSNGPQKIGGKANAAAPAAVDENDRVNASFDLYGRQRVLQDVGLSVFRSIDLDESEEEVKATAGKIAWLFISNLHATDKRYIKFYNATAANTTVGTTTPVLTLPWKALQEGWAPIPDGGLIFDTAITVAATTALADADTGAPGAGEVVINIGYR